MVAPTILDAGTPGLPSKVAPIALFAYARADHVRRTVDALLRNPEAPLTDLVVFSDAARSADKRTAVDEVRRYLASIEGFRSVTVHAREENFGLSRSIIEGVTRMLVDHDSVIVMEDDLVTSPHFLRFMNEGLDRFAQDERVISVHGYMYPVEEPLPEAVFLPGADCWGWATWRRGWALFNPDGIELLAQLEQRGLSESFDFNGSYPFTRMLKDQVAGLNDSWAVRWYASAFLLGKLTLNPGRSLVHNIGNDSSGTHSGTSELLDVDLASPPVDLSGALVEASTEARSAIERFFRRLGRSSAGSVRARARALVSAMVRSARGKP